MRELNVSIEIDGVQRHVGSITGNTPQDAVFYYAEEYIENGFPSISISLPVSAGSFSAEETRKYFEGLLPEGFARKSVAEWIHASEEDYLSILEVLGSECLGAIRVSDGEEKNGNYEKLSLEEVKELAKEGVTKSTELITEAHLSLTGASGKVGLYYNEKDHSWFKPMGMAPSTHIVKQSHVRLSGIVTNEQLSLTAASALGIDVPDSYILNVGGKEDDGVLFATRRYDRIIDEESVVIDGMSCPFRLHQEDFAQAMGIASKDKYEKGNRHYLSDIFSIVRNYTDNPIADQLKLWDILVYDFLIGNTDNHIKNLSLLYSKDLKKRKLAPAYDIVSTVIYPGSSREVAIGIGSELNIDKIGRNHFNVAAGEAGISARIAMARFDSLADGFEQALQESAYLLSQQGYDQAADIKERILKNGGYSHL